MIGDLRRSALRRQLANLALLQCWAVRARQLFVRARGDLSLSQRPAGAISFHKSLHSAKTRRHTGLWSRNTEHQAVTFTRNLQAARDRARDRLNYCRKQRIAYEAYASDTEPSRRTLRKLQEDEKRAQLDCSWARRSSARGRGLKSLGTRAERGVFFCGVRFHQPRMWSAKAHSRRPSSIPYTSPIK